MSQANPTVDRREFCSSSDIDENARRRALLLKRKESKRLREAASLINQLTVGLALVPPFKAFNAMKRRSSLHGIA